jgi:hypothetical protein
MIGKWRIVNGKWKRKIVNGASIHHLRFTIYLSDFREYFSRLAYVARRWSDNGLRVDEYLLALLDCALDVVFTNKINRSISISGC